MTRFLVFFCVFLRFLRLYWPVHFRPFVSEKQDVTAWRCGDDGDRTEDTARKGLGASRRLVLCYRR